MVLKRFLLAGSLAAVLVLAGCPAKQNPAAQPPAQATAPSLPAPVPAQTAPAAAPASATQQQTVPAPAQTANTERDRALIDAVEKAYHAGMSDYQQGHLASARANFDYAVDLMLKCKCDIRGDQTISDEFDRIVVGVDPPAGASEGSDACGIVVCGSRGEALSVLDDATVRGLSPEGWASRVAAAAARWDTAQVVAEANNGGAMVESVLKAADFGLRVRLVHASRGKSARAEPIALKFETGKAFFAGEFSKLEAELGGMIAGGGYEGPGRSPDRADAMVWAMTALSETRSGVPRVRRL